MALFSERRSNISEDTYRGHYALTSKSESMLQAKSETKKRKQWRR